MGVLTTIVNWLTHNHGDNGHTPDQISGLETIAQADAYSGQKVELYLGARGEDTTPDYIRKNNDLLYKAAFEGKMPSIKLPALHHATKKGVHTAYDTYSLLKKELKDASDTLLQDDVAIKILATIAFYNGVQFTTLNKFDDAYLSIAATFRDRSKFEADNDKIFNAFRGLLGAGYIAQGINEKGQNVLVGTAKLDQYIR